MDGYTEMRASAWQKDSWECFIKFCPCHLSVRIPQNTWYQSVVMSPIPSGIKVQYSGPVNSLEANACDLPASSKTLQEPVLRSTRYAASVQHIPIDHVRRTCWTASLNYSLTHSSCMVHAFTLFVSYSVAWSHSHILMMSCAMRQFHVLYLVYSFTLASQCHLVL